VKARAHVIFKGRVQGVFFRSNTQWKARELGIKGWVRNMWDGSVEAIFEGDKEKIEEVVEWCRNEQPYAKVTEVALNWQEYKGEFKDFEVRR